MSSAARDAVSHAWWEMGAALVELSAPATLEVLGRADLAELCAKDLDITLAAAKRILAVTSPRARGARRDAREGRAGPAATFSRRERFTRRLNGGPCGPSNASRAQGQRGPTIARIDSPRRSPSSTRRPLAAPPPLRHPFPPAPPPPRAGGACFRGSHIWHVPRSPWEAMSGKKTAWHPPFTHMLEQRCPRWITVRGEVQITTEPLRVDDLLEVSAQAPRDPSDTGETLHGMWEHIPRIGLLEFKSPVWPLGAALSWRRRRRRCPLEGGA